MSMCFASLLLLSHLKVQWRRLLFCSPDSLLSGYELCTRFCFLERIETSIISSKWPDAPGFAWMSHEAEIRTYTTLCFLTPIYPQCFCKKTAIKPLHVLSSFLLKLKKRVRQGICSVSLPLYRNSRTRASKCSSYLALCVTTYLCPILPKKIRGGTVRVFCSILSLQNRSG